MRYITGERAHTVINRRVEGGDDEERNAHIVKPPDELRDVPLAAAKHVADCGCQQAQHGSCCEDIYRPSLDRPCDVHELC